METKNVIQERWDKVSQKTKKWHMFVGESLHRNVPLMFFLIIMLELFDGYRYEDFTLVIMTSLLKLVAIYFVGAYSGHLEWEFLKGLVNKEFTSVKDIKRNYTMIYGVWMFGAMMTVAFLNPAFESLAMTIVTLIIYPLGGIFWGFVMSGFAGAHFGQYVSKK